MRLETELSAVSSLPFLEGLYVCFIRLVVFFDPLSKCVNVFVWCDSIGGGLVISYQTWATISQLHTTGRANGQKQKKGKVHEKWSRRNFVSKPQQDALACETHFHRWGKKHTFVCKRTRQVVTQHVQPCTLSHRVQFTSPERRVMQRVLLTHFWVRL